MSDPELSHLFTEKKSPSIESVEYSSRYRSGVFINNVYFDFETKKAIKFRRAKDSKILWVPKKCIFLSDCIRDRKKPQNVHLKFKPRNLHWR